MHAASLAREIRLKNGNISFHGIGGNELRNESVNLLYHTDDLNFIGFSSVIKNIKKIKSALNKTISKIRELNPDAVVLVDFPGFNLKIISAISKFYKGKVIYYISPQLWAWHKSRIKIIKKYVDLMIVVFPFETDFYKSEDINAEFVGHPLIKRIDGFLKSNHRQVQDKIIISMLPGSRKDEITRMLPVLMKSAKIFNKEFNAEINIICSLNFSKNFYKDFTRGTNINLIYDEDKSHLNYKAILNSDLVITKSGTSTIECALLNTPFCVVYKTGRFNYEIGRRLIKVKNIAMVNILLGKEAVKEFLQNEMTPENIFNEGKRILTDDNHRSKMKADFLNLRKILTDRDASENAAQLILNLIS